MSTNTSFRGKTVIITGASRGIGKAMRLAKDGANIVVAAKTATPHPKLPGTIYTAAEEMEQAGGRALACIVDVRDQASIQKCVDETIAKFGGIDILVNNASAIALTNTHDTDMKRYDLMHSINTRGTYLFTKLCLPHLKESARLGRNPHVLNISPPLAMEGHYFAGHVAYTMAKAEGAEGIEVGCASSVQLLNVDYTDNADSYPHLAPLERAALFWYRVIQTAASDNLHGPGGWGCRKVDIMSDAAHAMLSKPSSGRVLMFKGQGLFILLEHSLDFFTDSISIGYTGHFAIDEDVMRAEGVNDFEHYSVHPGDDLIPDFMIDMSKYQTFKSKM
ncbi:hypothetical protein PRIPAC_76847 [Pristionchus pacificus]|uniref:Hydroxysteroid dehydrogenase-like protein 2 n=1 Tax=Pristionchus pacificus TaxID=54126 RepID=A0A2A6CQG0_PRIPA|nr:hypothetical protein PRIPAC_76847 [Pristionchus pacificus]|eukprot:PDM80336.1 dehydrogenase [Pristionchus pacificus]